ncbi:unnamed protein product [Trifolium pratense]|uniref:Uncharacterized protein n=1 Tax=Trifolium pratense TaxID=57577 RepID=A0ACB0JWE6_TRIPR|nr:unnamed protein product [Trifolium pratense]
MFEWTSLEFAISSGTFASGLDTSSQLMCQSSGQSQYTSKQKFGHNAEIMPLVQDVAELLGMMVEDHKRIQPNVKTHARD